MHGLPWILAKTRPYARPPSRRHHRRGTPAVGRARVGRRGRQGWRPSPHARAQAIVLRRVERTTADGGSPSRMRVLMLLYFSAARLAPDVPDRGATQSASDERDERGGPAGGRGIRPPDAASTDRRATVVLLTDGGRGWPRRRPRSSTGTCSGSRELGRSGPQVGGRLDVLRHDAGDWAAPVRVAREVVGARS